MRCREQIRSGFVIFTGLPWDRKHWDSVVEPAERFLARGNNELAKNRAADFPPSGQRRCFEYGGDVGPAVRSDRKSAAKRQQQGETAGWPAADQHRRFLS